MKKSCLVLLLGFSLAEYADPGVYINDGPYYGNNIDVGLGLWGLGGGYGGGHGYLSGEGHHGGGRSWGSSLSLNFFNNYFISTSAKEFL